MRRTRAICVVAALLALGFVLSAPVISATGSAADRGVRAIATIATVEHQPTGRAGATTSLGVVFDSPDFVAHTAVIDLGHATTAYPVGARIEVLYDPADPVDVSLAAGASSPVVPWFVPVAFGAVMLAIVGLAARRAHWASSVLRENVWVITDSRLIERVVGDSVRRVVRAVELADAPDDTTILAAPVTWRARSLDQFVPRAWVAGSERDFIVAPPGGHPVWRFRRVRTLDQIDSRAAPTLQSRLG